MPKNREQFESKLMAAFKAGCNHGYGIRHDADIARQEHIGALNWVGKMSDEEFDKEWEAIINGE